MPPQQNEHTRLFFPHGLPWLHATAGEDVMMIDRDGDAPPPEHNSMSIPSSAMWVPLTSLSLTPSLPPPLGAAVAQEVELVGW